MLERKKWLIACISVIVLAAVFSSVYCFFTHTSEQTVIITEQFTRKLKKYSKLGSFHDGLALVQRDYNSWGYIDIEGNEVIPCIYKGTENGNHGFDFSEGMAVVINWDDKYGFINTKGEMVIKPQFQKAGSFSEGIASVFMDGKLNFIGKDGKYIEELSNKFIWDFNINSNLPQFKNGICEVHIPKKEPSGGVFADIIYIDKQGNQVEKPKESVKTETYVRYYKDDKVGYKDRIGNIIVPAKYTTLGDFSCGVAVATLEYDPKKHGMEEWSSDSYACIYGYVDLNGNETFKQQDYAKIEQAKINAEAERTRERLRREKEEAERRQMENVKSWIQGNWKCNTPYGEIRLGISGDYIAVFSNGRLVYTGEYTIENHNIIYDKHNGYASYIIIDTVNRRLMLDENTSMERFEGSNSSSYSTNREITFHVSSDVMSYIVGKTFYGENNVRIKIDWDGIYINGRRQYSGAPQIVSFSSNKAIIKISIIPNGELKFLVQPQKGNIVDMSDGYTYYAK